MALFIEYKFDQSVETNEQPGLVQSILNATGVYQWFVLRPRDAFSISTAVVEIDPAKDPHNTNVVWLHDICGQRESTVKILQAVAATKPAVIMLDKYYLDSFCGANQRLMDEVREISATIPVIIGRRISEETKLQRYLAETLPFKPEGESLNPPMVRAGKLLEYGVVNIDNDTRRLPLKWSAFDSATQEGERSYHETIALKVARAFHSADFNERHHRLLELIDKQIHPYVSFMPPSKFSCLPVGRLFSPDLSAPPDSPSKCQGRQIRVDQLGGKIVLIGEINKDLDEHASVLGPMDGLYMQANYVEALLDERYYDPMPVLDYVLGFGFVAALELALILYPGRWLRLAGIVLLLLASLAFLLWFFITSFKVYVNPVLIGGIAVLVKMVHSLFAPAEHIAAKARLHARN